jgi:hypothetical protein
MSITRGAQLVHAMLSPSSAWSSESAGEGMNVTVDLLPDDSVLDRCPRRASPVRCVQFLGLSSVRPNEGSAALGADSATAAGRQDVVAHARVVAALHRPDASGICLGCLDAGRLAGACCPPGEWARGVLRMVSRTGRPTHRADLPQRSSHVSACAVLPNPWYIRECEDPIVNQLVDDEGERAS